MSTNPWANKCINSFHFAESPSRFSVGVRTGWVADSCQCFLKVKFLPVSLVSSFFLVQLTFQRQAPIVYFFPFKLLSLLCLYCSFGPKNFETLFAEPVIRGLLDWHSLESISSRPTQERQDGNDNHCSHDGLSARRIHRRHVVIRRFPPRLPLYNPLS